MIEPHTKIVVGYHGCDREFARQFVTGELDLTANNRKYHWLGDGIYFWENDSQRALEWAQEKASRDEINDPCVIGGVIDLGRCLDLSSRKNVPLIQKAYESLKAVYEAEPTRPPMPINKAAPKDDRAKDKVLRFLDCAVINHLVTKVANNGFDTVRGLFVEGESIYEGGEIYHKTHVEIAVRDPTKILGLFIPRA